MAASISEVSCNSMARVKCYVDGFNLYHALSELKRPTLKWLNLRTVAEVMLQPGDELAGVHYFTAVVHWNKEKALRHRAYIEALLPVAQECAEQGGQDRRAGAC